MSTTAAAPLSAAVPLAAAAPLTAADLLAAAMKLPSKDREQLAEQLERSLYPTGKSVDDMTEEELKAELNRRHEEYLRDPSVGVSLEEVKRSMMGG